MTVLKLGAICAMWLFGLVAFMAAMATLHLAWKVGRRIGLLRPANTDAASAKLTTWEDDWMPAVNS